MDPLTLLREYVSAGRPWKVEGDEVVFGDARFPKEEPTAWRAGGRKETTERDKFYKLVELATLAEIVLLGEGGVLDKGKRPVPYTQYLKLVGEQKQSSFVSRLDYEDLLKYLRGETATADQIAEVPSLKRPAADEPAFEGQDLQLGDLSRSTGIDGPALAELKRILEAKRRRQEEEEHLGGAVGGEEEAWKADAEMHALLRSHERLASDRNGVLLTPGADYKMALEAIETLQRRQKEALAAANKAGASGAAGGGRRASVGGGVGGGGGLGQSGAPSGPLRTPIIIVPTDRNAVINMTNVADFLENAHFVGPQEKRDAQRVKQLVITKTLNDRPLRFKVIDNPAWLQESEWDAVVAVFSNGKAWQFSEWKYSTPVDLFHRCFGAVVHYDDEPLRGEAKGWNVKFYKVSKTKRHMDGIAVSQFWIQLGEWLKVHKPQYLQPPSSSSSSSSGRKSM